MVLTRVIDPGEVTFSCCTVAATAVSKLAISEA
jgi:hypothetical protein